MGRMILALCLLGSLGWTQDGGELEGLIIPVRRTVTLEKEVLDLFAAVSGQRAASFAGGSSQWFAFEGVLPLAPSASSTLSDDGHGPYGAEQGTDSTTHTVWSEGVPGPGIGQWLASQSPYLGNVVALYPGHPGSGWSANNRLKKGRIYLFAVRHAGGGGGGSQPRLEVSKTVYELTVSLPDQPGWRSVGVTEPMPEADAYLAVLVIDEVWRGSRWNDTVIAEFGLTVSQ